MLSLANVPPQSIRYARWRALSKSPLAEVRGLCNLCRRKLQSCWMVVTYAPTRTLLGCLSIQTILNKLLYAVQSKRKRFFVSCITTVHHLKDRQFCQFQAIEEIF